MNWQFAYPWVLALGLIIPLIGAFQIFQYRRRAGIGSSVPSRIAFAGGSIRSRTTWLPRLLAIISIALLIISLARPQEILEHTKHSRDAVAIELVVDRSGSMEDPVVFNNQRVTRLEAVKVVVEQFVKGNGDQLQGRSGDLLGLIVFGTYADTLMPLTQSHEVLIEAIRRIELPQKESERNTAIGDALMLAIARLKATEDAMRHESENKDFELKSKAVILLTDGENRTGTYSPAQAAALGAQWGVKIYIIGIKDKSLGNSILFGRNRQQSNDHRMKQIAEQTGGQYWPVDRIEDLEHVYAQIDELEKSTIEISETTSYRELFVPLAIAAFAFYFVSIVFGSTIYRSAL